MQKNFYKNKQIKVKNFNKRATVISIIILNQPNKYNNNKIIKFQINTKVNNKYP